MNDTEETLRKEVDKAVALLMEHCDTVHIFATIYKENGNTAAYNGGRGNWYARLGQLHEFLDTNNARTQAYEFSNIDTEDE